MKAKKNLKQVELLKAILFSFVIMISACGTNAQKENESTQQVPESNVLDIHAASFMGDLSAIKYHIKAGTDLNMKDQYGSTPLIIATTFNKVEVAKALIEGGADLSAKGGDGSTALHTAAFFCRTEIVKSLLEHGADKTLTNSFGSTPLQSVAGSFAEVKPIYMQINKDLGPLGLKLNYEVLEENRPLIAELLK